MGTQNRGTRDEEIRQGVEPPPVHPRAPIPQPVKKLLNRGLGAIDEVLGSAFGSGFEVVEIDHFDESFDEFFEKVAGFCPLRSGERRRFLELALQGHLHDRSGDRPRGQGERMGFSGTPSSRWPAPGRIEAKMAVYSTSRRFRGATTWRGRSCGETVRRFRRIGSHIIRYRFMSSPTTPRKEDLMRLGFFYRDSRRNTLLAKFADGGLDKVAHNADNWSYSIGDGEATFWSR